MRRLLIFLMVAAVIGAFAFSDAFARRGRGFCSQGMGFNRGFSPYMQQGMAQPRPMYGQGPFYQPGSMYGQGPFYPWAANNPNLNTQPPLNVPTAPGN